MTIEGRVQSDLVAGRSELDSFFGPKSVAIVGASAKPEKHGYRLVNHMLAVGYDLNVYPISRSADRILGFKTYSSLLDLPEPPELVLVSIPAEGIPDAIADAAASDARAAIIFAGGFAESGADGKARQLAVLKNARPAGLRIIGPNCMGVCDFHRPFFATYFTRLPAQPGEAAFVSQSGAFGGLAFAKLSRTVGMSKFASIGNMADVDHAELIRYLGADKDTRAIAMFVEGITDGPELLDAIAAVSGEKPIVILKGAQTAAGQAVAVSHTGSIAGDGRIWKALLREAGAVVAEDTDDLFDATSVLAMCGTRRPRTNNVAIATISGGPSVIAADACERYGLNLPELQEGLTGIEQYLPAFASTRNPVDFTSGVRAADWATVVGAVAHHTSVETVLAVNVELDVPEFAEAFVHEWREETKPIVGFVVGEQIERVLADAGVPNFPSIERAVRAVRTLVDRGRWLDRGNVDCAVWPASQRFEPQCGVVSEYEAKELLADTGVVTTAERLVCSLSEAREAAQALGYPVALKISSATIQHKTDVGGVILDVHDVGALDKGWKALLTRFPDGAVLVQEMVHGDVELIVGGLRDPTAGAVVMVGIGGILAEIARDVTFTRVPVSRSRAMDALSALKGQALLNGARGRAPVDREVLAELIGRVGGLLEANEWIVEVDLNPVIVSAGRAIVADALIRGVGQRTA